MDSNMQQGVVIFLVGIVIVFSALVMLFLIFKYIMPSIMDAFERSRLKAKGLKSEEILPKKERDISGEENAAIAAAIYQFFEEIHDDEDRVLTIQKVRKTYSPWSSKIYTTYASRIGMNK